MSSLLLLHIILSCFASSFIQNYNLPKLIRFDSLFDFISFYFILFHFILFYFIYSILLDIPCGGRWCPHIERSLTLQPSYARTATFRSHGTYCTVLYSTVRFYFDIFLSENYLVVIQPSF